jgi:hypothetical protein
LSEDLMMSVHVRLPDGGPFIGFLLKVVTGPRTVCGSEARTGDEGGRFIISDRGIPGTVWALVSHAAARNKKDGGNGLPPDALVTTFQGGITTSCVVPSAKVAEIGAALYLTERAQFRP